MTTDRELLEAAARAIGRSITAWNTQHGVDFALLDDFTFWQPLLVNHITDCMGDALRLAVKVGMIVNIIDNGTTIVDGVAEFEEQNEADPGAATRRAIVRAAAAMAPPG